jgi:hypothetical protein
MQCSCFVLGNSRIRSQLGGQLSPLSVKWSSSILPAGMISKIRLQPLPSTFVSIIKASTALDDIKNENTRKELKIKSGQNKTDESRDNWTNYLERITDGITEKQVLQINQMDAKTKEELRKDGL